MPASAIILTPVTTALRKASSSQRRFQRVNISGLSHKDTDEIFRTLMIDADAHSRPISH